MLTEKEFMLNRLNRMREELEKECESLEAKAELLSELWDKSIEERGYDHPYTRALGDEATILEDEAENYRETIEQVERAIEALEWVFNSPTSAYKTVGEENDEF